MKKLTAHQEISNAFCDYLDGEVENADVFLIIQEYIPMLGNSYNVWIDIASLYLDGVDFNVIEQDVLIPAFNEKILR